MPLPLSLLPPLPFPLPLSVTPSPFYFLQILEKGLLITESTLKLILIPEDTEQIPELLDIFKNLKSKLPSANSFQQSLSPKDLLPKWFKEFKSKWLGYSKLYFIVVTLTFLISTSYWVMRKYMYK